MVTRRNKMERNKDKNQALNCRRKQSQRAKQTPSKKHSNQEEKRQSLSKNNKIM